LGECGQIVTGSTPSKTNDAYWNGDIPFVTPAQLGHHTPVVKAQEYLTDSGAKRARLLPEGAVLICCIGSLGKTGIAGTPLVTNQQINAIVFDSDRVDAKYGFYVAKNLTPLLEHYAPSTTVKIVKKSAFAEFSIPLPPLPEQKRIAQILDAADALRAKRRESIAQLDALVQSTFLEMFGDPKINPMSWPVEPLSHVVAQLKGGKNIAESETTTDFKVLKVSAVTSGIFRPNESKYLPADFSVPDSYIVKAGDLLISRANTTELVGATAYVWETPENIALPDKLWRVEMKNNSQIEPLFLFVLSRGRHFRSMLSERASGTSGSMRNISKPKLLSTPIILPPVALQIRFTSVVRSIQTQKSLLQTHLSELNTLFASLQSRAFNGEL